MLQVLGKFSQALDFLKSYFGPGCQVKRSGNNSEKSRLLTVNFPERAISLMFFPAIDGGNLQYG